MERYIKEYANAKIKSWNENELMRSDIREKYIVIVNNVLRQRERGLITVDEALMLICKPPIDAIA